MVKYHLTITYWFENQYAGRVIDTVSIPCEEFYEASAQAVQARNSGILTSISSSLQRIVMPHQITDMLIERVQEITDAKTNSSGSTGDAVLLVQASSRRKAKTPPAV
jgi:hypothetical protein